MKNESSKKSSTVHASKSTHHVNHNATVTPSPEVSAPTSVLATSAAALAPAVAVAAPVTPPADLPPTQAVPAPPAGWAPAVKKKRAARGLRPKNAQISSAVAAAKELSQSPTYTADFGSRAPAAAQVSYLVTNASKWRDTWQAAKRFFVYASEQRAAWENDALGQMDALKPAFDYAASRDTSLAEKYSATTKFLGATNAIAERAVVSRKAGAKSKAKAAANETTATSSGSTAAAAAAPVVNAAPETPAVPAK